LHYFVSPSATFEIIDEVGREKAKSWQTRLQGFNKAEITKWLQTQTQSFSSRKRNSELAQHPAL